MKASRSLWLAVLCVNIGLCAAPGEAAPQRPGKSVQTLTPTQQQFKQQILNGYCCVPNMSSGYDTMKMVNGYWKKKGDPEEDVRISDPVFGVLNGKPVAVAPMIYWGGGSGYFGSILLYEQKNGRAQTVGSHPYGDRVDVLSLTVKDSKVRLVTRGGHSGPWRDEKRPKVTLLKRGDFDVAECIGRELPKPLERELKELEDIYGSGESSTPEQKRRAVEIIRGHHQDRTEFARLVRLTLEAAGWRPGPDPWRFDKDGNPSFYQDGELRADLIGTADE